MPIAKPRNYEPTLFDPERATPTELAREKFARKHGTDAAMQLRDNPVEMGDPMGIGGGLAKSVMIPVTAETLPKLPQAVQKMYAHAKRLIETGKTNREIWDETSAVMAKQNHPYVGVFTGSRDGIPRVELDDSIAKINRKLSGEDVSTGIKHAATAPLSDVYSHPELYKVIPELQSHEFKRMIIPDTTDGMRVGGHYDVANRRIAQQLDVGLDDVIFHEVQHGVNTFSPGAAKGTSPDYVKPFLEEYDKSVSSHVKSRNLASNMQSIRDFIERGKEVGIDKTYREAANNILRQADHWGDGNQLRTAVRQMRKADKWARHSGEDPGLAVTDYIARAKKEAGDHYVKANEWIGPWNPHITARGNYMNEFGEAEARQTQKRSGLSKAERAKIYPADDYDVNSGSFIVDRFGISATDSFVKSIPESKFSSRLARPSK